MKRKQSEPTYSLERVKELARSERFSTTKRVRAWLDNHGYVPAETIAEIVESAAPEDFYKSDELEILPGTMADIYRISHGSERWYLKFFIDPDTGSIRLSVLSCCWDSAMH